MRRKRANLVLVLILAAALFLAVLLSTSNQAHAGRLHVDVDKQPAQCGPVHCVQLRTITWRHDHHQVLQLTQQRHRPTESRNVPQWRPAWRAWHTIASSRGVFA